MPRPRLTAFFTSSPFDSFQSFRSHFGAHSITACIEYFESVRMIHLLFFVFASGDEPSSNETLSNARMMAINSARLFVCLPGHRSDRFLDVVFSEL